MQNYNLKTSQFEHKIPTMSRFIFSLKHNIIEIPNQFIFKSIHYRINEPAHQLFPKINKVPDKHPYSKLNSITYNGQDT